MILISACALIVCAGIVFVLVFYLGRFSAPQATSEIESVSVENQLYYEMLQSEFASEHTEKAPVDSVIGPYVQEACAYTFYSQEDKLYYVLIDLYFPGMDALEGKESIFVVLDKDFYWVSDHCSASLWTKEKEGGTYTKAKDLETMDKFTNCGIYISELEDVSGPFHIRFSFEAPWKDDEQIERVEYQYGVY